MAEPAVGLRARTDEGARVLLDLRVLDDTNTTTTTNNDNNNNNSNNIISCYMNINVNINTIKLIVL